MRNNRHNPEDTARSKSRPHEEFLELCALSTSGELSVEERKNLQTHLAACADCRQALKEFEAAAVLGVPLLHSHLSESDSLDSDVTPAELPFPNQTCESAHRETIPGQKKPAGGSSSLARPLVYADSHRHAQLNWNYVWVPFAAALVLTATLGIYTYELGKHKSQTAVRATLARPDQKVEGLEQEISDFGHERQNLKAQLAQRDERIAELDRQILAQSALLAETRKAQESLERSLQADEREKQEVAQERAGLNQKLDSLQNSLQKTETDLSSLKQRRSEDESRSESLEAQIKDLHGQLRAREQELGREQDLLEHDRDIRELMGARDLYIAEVFDVARDGHTEKPYGRVFYTRGKSLVFYAYDLDRQAGFKSSSAFQAWGSHGLDKQQATSLGVFYEDNAAKKRWVVKFDDPKKLDQIDAVFVTLEPNGGSHKPSGKPLLFAYLKVEPNHP